MSNAENAGTITPIARTTDASISELTMPLNPRRSSLNRPTTNTPSVSPAERMPLDEKVEKNNATAVSNASSARIRITALNSARSGIFHSSHASSAKSASVISSKLTVMVPTNPANLPTTNSQRCTGLASRA